MPEFQKLVSCYHLDCFLEMALQVAVILAVSKIMCAGCRSLGTMRVIGFGVRRGREFSRLIDFISSCMTGVPITSDMPPVLYKSLHVLV